jgi:hypothetical protein
MDDRLAKMECLRLAAERRKDADEILEVAKQFWQFISV